MSTENSNIITNAFSLFDNGNVPTIQFLREHMRVVNEALETQEKRMLTQDERRATDFMKSYAYCHQKISSLRIEGFLFTDRYESLLNDAPLAQPLLPRPLDIDKLKGMLADAEITLSEETATRQADRFEELQSKVGVVADDLTALNTRREKLIKMMTRLEADIKKVSGRIDDDSVEIDISDLYKADGGLVITDKKIVYSWEYRHYNYDATTGGLVELNDINNCTCDCCECDCGCDSCSSE